MFDSATQKNRTWEIFRIEIKEIQIGLPFTVNIHSLANGFERSSEILSLKYFSISTPSALTSTSSTSPNNPISDPISCSCKLNPKGWFVNIHHRASHHSFNIVIKNDVRTRQLITVTLNSERIVNLNIKCKSLWCIYEWDLHMVNIFVYRVIAYSIAGTPSSRRNPNTLSRTKW